VQREHSNTVSYTEAIYVEDTTFVRAKAERHMGRAPRMAPFLKYLTNKKNSPDKMGVPTLSLTMMSVTVTQPLASESFGDKEHTYCTEQRSSSSRDTEAIGAPKKNSSPLLQSFPHFKLLRPDVIFADSLHMILPAIIVSSLLYRSPITR
jgi:hypothetical protein